VHFYEWKPAGRGMDFGDSEDIESYFLKHVVDFHCRNPIADIKKNPLPCLEDLAEGVGH
jgi:hypothetical protein